MAARLEDIPEVGDWVEYKILNRSALVVRGEAGVKAFANICRHYGIAFVGGHGNCREQGLICPYHGWRYDMDGRNSFVFDRRIFSEESPQATQLNLLPIRCEFWGGCVFINFDMDAAPLLECIAPFAGLHDPHDIENLTVGQGLATELPANWKLAMEAVLGRFLFFPNYVLLPMDGTLASCRVRPLKPERCLFELWPLVPSARDEARPVLTAPELIADDDSRWPPILMRAFANIPQQQLGFHAEGIDHVCLSGDEARLIGNYQRLIDGFLAGLPRETLVAGMQATGDKRFPG
jgi:hypothetical protein